jgi:hypothetical protein
MSLSNPTAVDYMTARGMASSAIGGCFLPYMQPWRPDPRTGAVMSFDEWNQWVELGISTGGFGTTQVADIRAGVLNAQRHWGTGCTGGPPGYGTSWVVGSAATAGPRPAWFDPTHHDNPAIYAQAAKDYAAVTTGKDPVTGAAILKDPIGVTPAPWTAATSAPAGTPIVPTVPTTPTLPAPGSRPVSTQSIQVPAATGGGLSIGTILLLIGAFLIFK